MRRSANARPRSAWVEEEADDLSRLEDRVGGIGIYETDFERNRTRFSPALCAILGLPVGTEMTLQQASRLFDERDRASVQRSVESAARAVDTGKWSGVHRVLRADGAVRWVSIQGRRTYRDTPCGPQSVRSIGTVVDITDLKQAADALRESEHRLRLALDAAQMGTFEADITGSQAVIDAQEARLLGLPKDTHVVSAEELRKRVPLEDLKVSDAKQKRLTEYSEAYQHEFRFLLPDGSERWLGARADIRSNRIFGVNFDITERKRAEAALRQSEACLRIATSGAALGVFEWDGKADRAVWVNDRMYEIFGRAPRDGPLSKQQFVSNHLHPNDADEFEAALREAMRRGGEFHTVCRIRRTDGSLRWLQIDGKFAVTEGDPLRLVGVVSDITARKRLEREAVRLSERLATIQEKERQAIAQELHDSTVQHLVAANLSLMRLRPATPSGVASEEELWKDVQSSLEEAMKELRTFSYLMHPPALGTRRLYSVLSHYVAGFASRAGLDISLRLNPRVDKLPIRVQRSLFRIVQAALANVYRHASASRASVDVRCIGSRLHLIISDNGCGLSRQHKGRPSVPPGVGMRGIRARLNGVGGNFKIVRAKSRGVRLHAVIPIAASPGATPADAAQASWRRGCPELGLACPDDTLREKCPMHQEFRCRVDR